MNDLCVAMYNHEKGYKSIEKYIYNGSTYIMERRI